MLLAFEALEDLQLVLHTKRVVGFVSWRDVDADMALLCYVVPVTLLLVGHLVQKGAHNLAVMNVELLLWCTRDAPVKRTVSQTEWRSRRLHAAGVLDGWAVVGIR